MTDDYGLGTIGDRAIADGSVTDAYFKRTEETLEHLGDNPHVVAEITADQFADGEMEVFCGLEEVVNLVERANLDIDLYSIDEGTNFDGGPVMRIEGNYLDFARYETPILGLLSQSSGYATAARRIVEAANGTPVLSFGSRHIHPAMAPFMERAAYVGGVNGYSNCGAEHAVPQEPSGTMPHALMLTQGQGNQERAWNGFDEAVDDDVPRIALADTFTDEVDEARRAADCLGDSLDGVRLDTTSSRRGDFKHIIREVRYELDAIGREDVDIYVSGGIDVSAVKRLRPFVDGFGIGSAITDANPVDFGLDIVEVDGQDISKRGKLSGVKEDHRMKQIL
jgi:nicotinate phosphoribosyltransferase